MLHNARMAIICIIALSAGIVSCGSDDGRQSSTSPTYRFNLQPGSTIMNEGQQPEVLTGYFTVTEAAEQSPQFLFYVKLNQLRFRSSNFAVAAADGRVWATPGLLQMSFVANGTLNDAPVEIHGGGGPQSYLDGAHRRQVPTRLRDLLLQAGEGVTLRINAIRSDQP